MTTERFNVVLQGSTLRGQDVATVATELAKLIKRDTDFATHLLRGQSTKLKSGIDAATGARYIEALERIGVAVRLEPETLEVDADLSARPVIANQDQPRNSAAVAGARAAVHVHAEGKFHGDGQQRVAVGVGPVSVPGKTGPDTEGAALAWPRLWARQIDFALCWATTVGLVALVGATQLLATSNIFVQLVVYSLLSALVLVGYETLSLGALGTTLGKAVLGLRVETRSGAKIDFGRALRRSLGVWWRGCGAYLFFPFMTMGTWLHSYRRLQKDGSTPWDDSCVTRVAGGPVPLWRATLAGVMAITAFTIVFGFEVGVRKEISREAQESILRSHGLSPTPARTAAPSNPFANPNFGKTPVETRQPEPNPSDADAQFALGMRYDSGQGVPQDYAEAVKWYRKAADQGNASAQNSLGMMYANGLGVPQDFAEAVKWYRKAAVQGNTLAYGNLGIMYEYGRGVPQDHAEAMKWIGKAEAR